MKMLRWHLPDFPVLILVEIINITRAIEDRDFQSMPPL
jgi:hypothetical protein